jgi:hypothetical protein
MKSLFGSERQSKQKESLPEFRSRLFENQGTHFHSSFFIFHYTMKDRIIIHHTPSAVPLSAEYCTILKI